MRVEEVALDEPSVYALSDLHTDHPENMQMLADLRSRPNDVVILAGDISDNLDTVRKTLKIFTQKFGTVFFCPGNHDLWLRSKSGFGDSLEKLHALFALCEELGVHTQPKAVGKDLLIVPLLAWYESGFDREPEIEDDSLEPVEKSMTDFMLCKWPSGLSSLDGSLAKQIDHLNGDCPNTADFNVVISFSHFLPLPELLPEKRFLFYPHLAKAVGSRVLGERVRRIKPNCHVFGHTHFGWDAEVEGIRFLQGAVAYPLERKTRGFSLDLADDSNSVATNVSGGVKSPILVYDAGQKAFPQYHGFWSNYYKKYPRKPSDVCWNYRGKRDQMQVRLVVRQLIRSGQEVEDTAIQRLLDSGEY